MSERKPNLVASVLEQGTELFRIHRKNKSPLEFDYRDFRFDDPDGEDPRFLTNYFSADPLGSYVEVFGRMQALTPTSFEAYRLSKLTLNRHIVVVQLDHPSHLGELGINGEHFSSPIYNKSQLIARDLFEEGYKGILYPLRYSLSLYIPGIVLFATQRVEEDLFDFDEPDPIPATLKLQASDIYSLHSHKRG